jgi:hypothetical protein
MQAWAVQAVKPMPDGQSLSWLHWTHSSLSASPIVSQTGVFPVHAVLFVAVHCTQWLMVVSHAGPDALPTQFASAVHCTQVLEVVLQAGFGALQFAFVVHCTHVLVARLQAGFGALQFVLLTHCTQPADEPVVPLQTSFDGHAWFALLLPEGSLLHMPTEPFSAQLLHVPLQALLQHTPSTQKVLVHWLPSPFVHGEPFACAGAQWLWALQ